MDDQISRPLNLICPLPSIELEIKPIRYKECAEAMLSMWIDKVVTGGEYNRIMDKLNDFERRRREKENG